jgi:uncharacterized membrane protein
MEKMNKNAFLLELKKGLNFLQESDCEDRLNFYSEMIDDYVEEGLTEEDAINKIGSAEKIIEQIIIETPFNKVFKEKIKPQKKLRVWELILIILGSPIWLSLLIAGFAVILSIYIVIWALVISLWAVFGSLIVTALGCIILGILEFIIADFKMGLIFLSLALIGLGIGILLYCGALALIKLVVKMTKKMFLLLKMSFIKRGE